MEFRNQSVWLVTGLREDESSVCSPSVMHGMMSKCLHAFYLKKSSENTARRRMM